jgi:alpha-beta hydrolase superfamily lysophospholipase
MNADTVAFLDELVDALLARHGLPASTPIIATGGSMGGHAALAYTLKSRHSVARCLAICPVTDLNFHYTERPDLPRTFHSAFRSYGDISASLREYSPLHQADEMPQVPYLIVHGEKDQAVAKSRHSDPLIRAMRKAGHAENLTYLELPNMQHCNPWDHASLRATIDFVSAGIPA